MAAAALAIGCRGLPQPGAAVTARLGDEFLLPRGQTAAIAGEPLTVRFLAVLEDSRCPADVRCVRAGEAKVHLELRLRGRDAGEVTVATAGGRPRYASYGAYDVHLAGLDPQPVTGAPNPRYVARLRVLRH